ncbi:MAG: hypothetical protein COB30_011710 [Ectothiorhodospiraceae bacterium]|nr:hypothetical protein [Ectothiorhodospiraceae bacterium]
MDLNELYSGMRAALESPVDAATIDLLSTEAARYASTVGWANGVIDKDDTIVRAFDKLRETAEIRCQQDRNTDIATLHDALAALVLAISTHDEDIDPSPDNDDLNHDT